MLRLGTRVSMTLRMAGPVSTVIADRSINIKLQAKLQPAFPPGPILWEIRSLVVLTAYRDLHA